MQKPQKRLKRSISRFMLLKIRFMLQKKNDDFTELHI